MTTTDDPKYLFEVLHGDELLRFYSDRTYTVTFPLSAEEERFVLPSETASGLWGEDGGTLLITEYRMVHSKLYSAVEELQAAYDQWYSRLNQIVAKMVVE